MDKDESFPGCGIMQKTRMFWNNRMSSLLKPFFTAGICLFFAACATAGSLLQEMSGHEFSWSDLQGKWVLVNYWASWCRICLDEIPELNHFYEANKKNNIAMCAVNYDELPLPAQKKLISQLDMRYPSLQKDPAAALELGDIRGVPVTFIFNPQGQLSSTLYGGQTMGSLKEALIAQGYPEG